MGALAMFAVVVTLAFLTFVPVQARLKSVLLDCVPVSLSLREELPEGKSLRPLVILIQTFIKVAVQTFVYAFFSLSLKARRVIMLTTVCRGPGYVKSLKLWDTEGLVHWSKKKKISAVHLLNSFQHKHY